jgi:AraC family transcriptional regulator, ethanolamine operon transcriptional activator
MRVGYPNSASEVLMAPSPTGSFLEPRLLEAAFDDIDAMAASPLAWDLEYEQIGRGRFEGQLTQLVLKSLQLARVIWSPGVLQRGAAPVGTWVFGLPLVAEGSLHVRRRPARPGELMAATSRDDVGFTATGRTDIMVIVLPTLLIDRWVQARRGIDRFDVDLPSPRWQVSTDEMTQRAYSLSGLLHTLTTQPGNSLVASDLSQVEDRICDAIFEMIPSAEVIEPLHSRARIARAVLDLLQERLDDPPSITELCLAVGARERTLHLSCVEAFGRPPAKLLAELRLNAAHRVLLHPAKETSVTSVAGHYGFTHFGRFAAAYRRQFGELPSITFAKARGSC